MYRSLIYPLQCYSAAEDVISVFIDELTNQREYIRHGPEAQSVFVVFASAIMIKVKGSLFSIDVCSHLLVAASSEVQFVPQARAKDRDSRPRPQAH